MERKERALVTGFANRPHRLSCVKKTKAKDGLSPLQTRPWHPVHTGLHRAKPNMRNARCHRLPRDVIFANCDVRWHDRGSRPLGVTPEQANAFLVFADSRLGLFSVRLRALEAHGDQGEEDACETYRGWGVHTLPLHGNTTSPVFLRAITIHGDRTAGGAGGGVRPGDSSWPYCDRLSHQGP